MAEELPEESPDTSRPFRAAPPGRLGTAKIGYLGCWEEYLHTKVHGHKVLKDSYMRKTATSESIGMIREMQPSR
jgi:hypothetical protein